MSFQTLFRINFVRTSSAKPLHNGRVEKAYRKRLALLVPLVLSPFTAFSTAEAASNEDILADIVGNIAACNLSRRWMADINPNPLFESNNGSCDVVADDIGPVQTLFSDPACLEAFSYRTTTLAEYCLRTLDKELLGNGADLVNDEPFWSLSPGSRYDFGALQLTGLLQPYVSRVPYKTVDTAGGTCVLEMRIYKSSPTETGLTSMVALHGGSWTSRGFGFFGLEMTVPHFTNAGFVVFAPFYRLLDSREGGAACNNATIEEITADADDALQWVRANAENWGGNNYPAVFGQSAGAHLAASLSVHRADQISNSVLFYPPTDFTDFVSEILNGNYTNEQGLSILERVIGGEADTVDVSASPIPENTFPAIVESNPTAYPPMFMLHGLADELVEARQALRLCAGLGGDVAAAVDADALRESPELRHKLDCDDRLSAVHLFKEGEHALDVCLSNNPLLSSVCLSGSEQSRDLVADSVSSAVAWAVSVAAIRTENGITIPPTQSPEGGQSSKSSGGASAISILSLLLMLLYRRRGFCRGTRITSGNFQ